MPSPFESSASLPAQNEPSSLTAQPVRVKSAWREYAEAFATALILALLIRSFVVQAFKIPSGSMLPTLQIGDHILVNKFIYGIRLPIAGTLLIPISAPQRGDVVVFVYPVDPSKDFIKRVAGVGGDVIQIRGKQVYVNGQVWDDPHAYFADGTAAAHGSSPRDTYGPVTVPPGHIFVLGDNRDRSYDSRFWGFVDVNEVKGRAFLIYWSWDGDDHWVRWGRIGELIH
jgi:signal peptidase I